MRLARTLLLALVAAFVASAPAHAAGRLVIRGRGYGHGIGMSQYGAYGYAKHGVGYRDILGHYYSGTAIGRADPGKQVRVLLKSSTKSLSFSGATRIGDRDLNPETTYFVGPSGIDRLVLKSPGGHKLEEFGREVTASGDGPLLLRGAAANGLSNGRYRGSLAFRRGAIGSVLAINSVSLELYVRGVISAESPSSWPADALRAQAVAARTYAITTNAGGNAGFDQYADTRSQMYRGVAAERPTTDDAQRSTEGEIVTYNGNPVVTYFFSTSGGRTENVENSFIGATPRPWLRSVEDPYDDASPKHTLDHPDEPQGRGVEAPRPREGLVPRDQGRRARRVAARRARARARQPWLDACDRPAAALAPRPLRHVGFLHAHHLQKEEEGEGEDDAAAPPPPPRPSRAAAPRPRARPPRLRPPACWRAMSPRPARDSGSAYSA